MNVDEAFVRKTHNQRRTGVCHGKNQRKIIKISMEMRMKDEKAHLKAMKRDLNEARKDLINIYGKNTIKFKREITRLNKMCKLSRKREDERHEGQLHHLRRKHGEAKRMREDEPKMKGGYIPKWKDKFKGLSIYLEEDDDAFQELLKQVDKEHDDEEVINIGGADLDHQEKQLLKLPPGMSLDPKLTERDFDCKTEESFSTLRMELRKWKEHDADHEGGLEECRWNELGEDEKVRREKEDAAQTNI